MSDPSLPRVGDRLWFVHDDLRHAEWNGWLEVTKVGRRWLETVWCSGEFRMGCSAHRIDKRMLFADGGGYSSPGRAYRHVEDWQVEQAAAALHRRIANDWGIFRKAAITRAQIVAIAEILGIDPESLFPAPPAEATDAC